MNNIFFVTVYLVLPFYFTLLHFTWLSFRVKFSFCSVALHFLTKIYKYKYKCEYIIALWITEYSFRWWFLFCRLLSHYLSEEAFGRRAWVEEIYKTYNIFSIIHINPNNWKRRKTELSLLDWWAMSLKYTYSHIFASNAVIFSNQCFRIILYIFVCVCVCVAPVLLLFLFLIRFQILQSFLFLRENVCVFFMVCHSLCVRLLC